LRQLVLAVGLLTLLVAVTATVSAATPPDLHGLLRTNQGQRLLYLWGSYYDMGFAHGYLLADDIMQLMRVYAFPPEWADPWVYEMARDFVQNVFQYPDDRFLDEAQGIYDGMLAAGIPAYVDVIDRDFDVWDLITFNGLNDIRAVFCTTLAGWNSTTAMDADLQGEIAVAHNTDFINEFAEAHLLIGEKSIIFSYAPDDPGVQRVVSVGNAGLLGSPAAMNESGAVALLNMGAAFGTVQEPDLDPRPQLVGWPTRAALSERDGTSDGLYTYDDYFRYFDGVYQFSSMMHQVAVARALREPPFAVLELANAGRAMRYPDDDPNVAPDAMIVLNWEDALAPERTPKAQELYDDSLRLVNDVYGRQLTLANLWDFLYQRQLDGLADATMQSMILLPESRRLGVAFTDQTAMAPEKEPVWYEFDDFFPEVDVDDDDDNDDDSDGPPAPDADDDESDGHESSDDDGGCF
jgi:hypothetical protein